MSAAPWARMRATTASMSSTANMTRRMPSVFIGASTGPKPDRVGRVELVQLNALTIGSPHHRERGPDILEPDQAPDRRPFDCRLALQLEAQFDEERLDGFEIVDNDEDVVHPFKRHILPSLASRLMPEPTEIEPSLGRTTCEYRRAGSERVNA